jgi:hypothetical protein
MKTHRLTVTIMVLAAAVTTFAAETIRPVAAVGDLQLLTTPQREWLAAFETGALENTAENADKNAAAEWLRNAASGARKAGLANTAAYLITAAGVLRGEMPAIDAEKAWRLTANDPLLVIVHFDGARIGDITVCTCDPARTKAVEGAIEAFERSLPGFERSWLDRSPTRPMTRIANLHFRAGQGANKASTGTYLPFDRSLTPQVGRTWIVYENMIRANWWGEALRPIALRVMPSAASKVTAEAMVAWYGYRAPIYDAGPRLTTADRDRLGAGKDPIDIMKGDLLPILVDASSDDSQATLVTVSFDTLRDVAHGDAPPPHKIASTTELNWLIARGALQFDEASVTWRIDFPRCRDAVRDLASEVMAIERSGDAKRAEALFARYAGASTAIDKTLQTIDTLARVKVQPLFVR